METNYNEHRVKIPTRTKAGWRDGTSIFGAKRAWKRLSSGQVKSFYRKLQCTIFGSLYAISDCDDFINQFDFAF